MKARRKAAHDRTTSALLAETARLLASGEAGSIDSARRKAAERIGVARPVVWPSDEEVREALSNYQSLFAHTPRLRRRRRMLEASHEAMRYLADFGPQLIIDSIDESAREEDAVELLLYADDPDAVSRWLDEQGIRHDQHRMKLRASSASSVVTEIDALDFVAGETAFRVIPVPTAWQRQGIRVGSGSDVLRRAGPAEVRRLIDDEPD